ncbi:MAG: hypothetical protein J5494_04935 [Candidatus Methanomethylophilaceae archaeon]|nr:hypothetical protein [Candidatus Methanomethylophilaceae archaeon]
MKFEEYKELYGSLKSVKDIKRLSGTYDERLLDTLFTQKTNREVKKITTALKRTPERCSRSGPRENP